VPHAVTLFGRECTSLACALTLAYGHCQQQEDGTLLLNTAKSTFTGISTAAWLEVLGLQGIKKVWCTSQAVIFHTEGKPMVKLAQSSYAHCFKI
jgi:hypothetical protein